MSHANKTGLPCYKRGETLAYCAKITGMEICQSRQHDFLGAMTLLFGDIGKRSELKPVWLNQYHPEIGGYFVVEDGDDGFTKTTYESEKAFEDNYIKD